MATIMKVRLTFLDEVLGTNPGSKDVHERFIASKSPTAETRTEELEHITEEEMVAKEKTVFYRNPETGEPEIACYQILGFFKAACGFLRNVSGTESKNLKAYKKKIDGLVKVYPDAKDKTGRFIPVHMSGEMSDCQRPLRASTAQGERVALSNSEAIPAGSTMEFDIYLVDPSLGDLIYEWLDYGELSGLGAWRNSGKGAFCWDELSADGKEVVGGNACNYR